uniref:ShKT domain-containing protein n=1 Tax=Panagrellus redivivus TaxID=6233 RepID=A0A7E4ZU79_PANRE
MLHISVDPPNSIRPYSGFGPIVGQTPCCHDRMTTVSCNRLQLLNPALFLYNCVHTPDFALVQCCRSCFDKRSPFTLNLDYDKIVDVLLTNPTTSDCTDRRGAAWCERLVKRKSFWEQRRFKGLDCSSMPFAFRVCRQSCGYCSSHEKKATVVYDYKVSTDIARCNNPAYGLAVPPAEHKTIDLPFRHKTLVHTVYQNLYLKTFSLPTNPKPNPNNTASNNDNNNPKSG